MRVAVVSSPRSGNTWVRSVLGSTLGLNQIAAHNYLDIDNVPERCILQIHWYREPNFQKFILNNDFKVVVISRHPLDIFLSVLHFIKREPLTSRWLEGNVAIPDMLSDKGPSSPEFVEYATSWGAENLLSVTYQWWHDPDAIKVRYEDLNQDPVSTFRSLISRLGESADVEPALERFSKKFFQNLPNKHGWQGQAGLWRDLIVPADAYRIYRSHKRIFNALGYSVFPSWLTRRMAAQRWEQLKR